MTSESHTPQDPSPQAPASAANPARTLLMLGYGLCALGMLIPVVPALAGAGLLFAKRADLVGSWCESHSTWLMRSVVIYTILWVVGFGLSWLGIGGFVMLVAQFYYIYRVGKGFYLFSSAKPIANPVGFI